MFTVKVKDEIIGHCNEQLKQYNFGMRGKADGTPEQQWVGIVGQTVVLDLFGRPWVNGGMGFDGGVDMEFEHLSIDIKTMGRTTRVKPWYVNNFIGLQKDYPAQSYLFTSFNKKSFQLTITGWLPKEVLFKRATFFEKGMVRIRSDGSSFCTFADLYEIENKQLYQIRSLDDLKNQWRQYVKKIYYNKNKEQEKE